MFPKWQRSYDDTDDDNRDGDGGGEGDGNWDADDEVLKFCVKYDDDDGDNNDDDDGENNDDSEGDILWWGGLQI